MNKTRVKWWRWDRENCVLETQDPQTARQIASWQFSKLFAYGVNHYRKVFIIPAKKLRQACRHLGIPEPEKNQGRMKAGKKSQANLKGQLLLFDDNESTGQDE